MGVRRKNKLVSPVVKWVGGKRQLLHEIEKHIPKKFGIYYEPFIGGGSVLFHLQPKHSVINDYNEELINLYKTIRKNPDELIEDLKKHINDEEYYYKTRALDRSANMYNKLSDIEKASRIIFLNKTCYNGLFRVNSSGEFNSPFGRYKNPNIINDVTIRAVSNYFKNNNIKILNADYKDSLSDAKKGDFVYFDPPYDPVSDSSNFTGYTKTGFGKNEQERLKNVCDELNKKGVNFLLSNSSTSYIKDLYKNYNIITVNAKRSINSKKDGRGEVTELLIKNYD
ncbi:MAG: modification methylase [Alphaproteobacteria bacterium CG11_big_fil_rev_8_21_14_0_20_39_49]|nr:MAG: modification methylase [Alphaproteobacteria bacterium CG11_big_fil_rev_8_21_14_0_20_39_49]